MRMLLFVAILFVFNALTFAQPVGLDTNYGIEGYATASILPADDAALDMVLLPDGKTVVVGRSSLDSVSQFSAIRYLVNGQLDPTFNWNGRAVFFGLGNGPATANAATLDANNNIVMAGYSTNGGDENFALLRVLPDGSLDKSFGNNGRVLTDFGATKEQINGVVIQPDGRIVVAGFSGVGRMADFAVARYMPNGSLDPSFGTNGRVITTLDTLSDIAWDLALQTDGKIVVCGSTADSKVTNFPSDFAIVRYNANGTLDQTFGTQGIDRQDVLGDSDVPRSLKIYPSGKMLVAGFASLSPRIKVVIIRLRANGGLDNFFGNSTGGISVFEPGPYGNFCTDIDFASDGKLLLSGMTENVDFKDVFVMRALENGILDNSFGQNGKVLRSLTPKDDNAYAISVRPNGKILLAGDTRAGESFTLNATLFQFNADGSEDKAFGQDGATSTDASTSIDEVLSMSLFPDGSVLTGGYTTNEIGREDALLARFKPDGTLDKNFGSEGLKVFQYSVFGDFFNKIARQTDGKIAAVGSVGGKASLFRLGTDGMPDNSFGSNGRVTPNLAQASNLSDLALQNDGKIVVAGHQGGFVGTSGIVMRYQANGKVDSTFGNIGMVLPPNAENVNQVLLLPDGTILALSNTSNPQGFRVSKMRPNGDLDPTFGTNGVYISEAAQTGNAMALGKNGSIFVAGTTKDKNLIVKLLDNGKRDVSFAANGTAVFGSGALEALSNIGIQADGRIVATGCDCSPALPVRSSLVYRLNPDGSYDATWGQNGRITLRGEKTTALLADTDGNWYVGGYLDLGERADLRVLRLLRGPYLGVLAGDKSGNQIVQVFPNPIGSTLTLSYELLENQAVNIRLFDLRGKWIHTFLTNAPRESGLQTETLNMPQLPVGTYSLVLETPKGRVAVQIIKAE